MLALSKEVIDDFPVSDPRWAESIPAGQWIQNTNALVGTLVRVKPLSHSWFKLLQIQENVDSRRISHESI